jgi:hypothetical protein
VAPVGYRTSKKGRPYYRQPAYLLTTDLTTPAVLLLQDSHLLIRGIRMGRLG